MTTTITITGKALVQFMFDSIPSWNEAIHEMNRHRMKGHAFTKRYRTLGEKLAQDFMTQCHPYREHLIERRAFVWVKVYDESEYVYDIHNVWFKAILDGFSDAKIWPNDEWAWVPHVMLSWMPPQDMGTGYGTRFVIEIHELGRIEDNGVALILPTGRITKGKR